MSKTIIGVMGPGSSPTESDLEYAYTLGRLIAEKKWVLLTGGRHAGVMHEASRGASEAGGLTVGILPGSSRSGASPYVDIPVVTGMGSARNNINVLTADVVIACGSGAGTTSEIMLALKAKKAVVLLNQSEEALEFFNSSVPGKKRLHIAETPQEAISKAENLL